MSKPKISFPMSDRIFGFKTLSHNPQRVDVVWRDGVRYDAYPTIVEQTQALEYAESLEPPRSLVQFPSGLEHYRRCLDCGWPTQKQLCAACYGMSRMSVVLESRELKVTRKTNSHEVYINVQRLEYLAQKYLTLANTLSTHLQERGLDEPSKTKSTIMWSCDESCKTIIVCVEGYHPRCPTCAARMSTTGETDGKEG